METIYRLRDDDALIRVMQEASLSSRANAGLSPTPFLVGSEEWWAAGADGRLVCREMNGVITRVYWGSMGDWPEFELTDESGERRSWTREGDISRYVDGARAKVIWVEHPWKPSVAQRMLADHSLVVLEIHVEDVGRRSDPRPPGPFAHS